MKSPIRFNNFLFYPETGRLDRQDQSGGLVENRLAPQPCKLLLLLLENQPHVVSQEKIREVLWPEVRVDFEKSLHYCIRQIRAALQDSASSPQYIETVPRRGYRWIAGVKEGKSAAPDRRLFVVGSIAMAILLFYSLAFGPAGEPAIRVAVMSFQPEALTNAFTGNDIALQLVESLTNRPPGPVEVIGPSTTNNYSQRQLRTLAQDFEIDCIINGKFSMVGDTSRLLAEVIRVEDGAHVWVRYIDAGPDNTSIAEMIHAGFWEAFEQNNSYDW